MSEEIRKRPKRIAFFVEGQTEQIFLHRLVKDFFGEGNTNILLKQFRGGSNIPRQEIIRFRAISRKARYEILISDCGSDSRVKSEIMENLVNLRKNGYEMIVGVRDLYPIPAKDLEKLEKGLRFLPLNLKSEASYFDIVVAIHEIEAWFMAETNHFRKVDKRLTGSFIKDYLGFNPFTSSAELREHPAKDLNDIYQLVDKSYTKRQWQVEKLVKRLDLEHLLKDVRKELKSFDKLVSILENLR